MKSIKYIPLAVAALAAASCSDDYLNRGEDGSSKTEITVAAEYPLTTRATLTAFEPGDEIGIFVDSYSDGNPAGLAAEIYARNIKFTLDDSQTIWTPSTPLYWESAKDGADIYGYYPFDNSLADATSYNFTVEARQDRAATDGAKGGYEASDLLRAKATKCMPGGGTVNLTFNHMMAGVRVELTHGESIPDTEWTELSKQVTIRNTVTSATVNLETGEVSPAHGESVEIRPVSYGSEYRAVVVPQKVAAGVELLSITVDGKPYSFKRGEVSDFTSGRMHSFTISVERKADGGDYELKVVDESIQPWIDDPDFHDGIRRDYVIVQSEGAGTLKDVMTKKGIHMSSLFNLKIVGEISQDDIEFLRQEAPLLSNINLYEAKLMKNGQPTYGSGYFNGISTLEHVVLPQNVKYIETEAFCRTGLFGSLVLPEGVEVIGRGAYRDTKLRGTVSLPSTLRIIEELAFGYVNLSGELQLPENLETLGKGAFNGATFTGSFILPEKLKTIGAAAIKGDFQGDLVIPQGWTSIPDFAFNIMTFTGGLELPEGLTEIGTQAFIGCGFNGELKLPSSLRVVKSRAFYNNNFSKIIFNDAISVIEDGVFAHNRNLKNVELPKKIVRISEDLFRECSSLEEVVIPEGVTCIQGAAFKDCAYLTRIVVNNSEPPLMENIMEYDGWDAHACGPFDAVPLVNISLEVPEKSVESYRRAAGWKEFKRISAYSNFVCRPATACALATARSQQLTLNADGEWEVVMKPDWCTISQTSGSGKSNLKLNIRSMNKGSGSRTGEVVFRLKGTEFTTSCAVSQYAEYDEDECIQLQQATVGNGINMVILAEGFDAESLASGKFREQAEAQMEAFFGLPPYSTFRDRFNVYMAVSLSQENGVNTLNTWRDTAFSVIYAGSESQLMPDDSDLIYDYVTDNTPVKSQLDRAVIIVSVNSDEYGGATVYRNDGAPISFCCRGTTYPSDTRGIVQHEAGGHGFGKLGDELITRNAFASTSVKSALRQMQDRGWWRNLSLSGKMTEVAWSDLIFDTRYSDAVDIYEGGLGYTRGIYRSEINSCMNYAIPYYNAISRREIMRRILDYSGEGYTDDKFRQYDTDQWGAGATRAATQGGYLVGQHRAPVILKAPSHKISNAPGRF